MTKFMRPHHAILLLALLTGGVLRLWSLDTLPLGLYHDEAYNGLDALALTEGMTFPIFHEAWELYAADAHADRPPVPQKYPLFFEGNYGREPLHVYLMAASVALLGPTPLAVRLVPAVAGILGIWTTYLAAGALLGADRRYHLAPAVAALTLAVLYPAVHFSRFGLRVMLFVPLSTLCIAFFWRALNAWFDQQKVDWGAWAISGVLLGGSLYVYAAGRLFPLLYLLFVPLLVWHEKASWRRLVKPISLMAGVSLLTALPLLIYFFRYPYFFFFRIGYVANRGRGTVAGRPLLTWLYNVPRVVQGIFWRGETHFRHNLPGRPFVDPLQGMALLWGTVALKRLSPAKERSLRTIFLFLWLGVMLLPTILSGDAPHFGRMTGAMPVVAILIGVGLSDLASRLPKRWLLVVVIAVPLLSGLWTTFDYFVRYQNHPLMAVDFDWPDWAAGRALTAYPYADYYLTPTRPETATVLFALGNRRDNLRLLNLNQTLVTTGRPGVPAVFVVSQEAKEVQEQLAEALALPAVVYTGASAAGHQFLIIDSAGPRLSWDRSVDHSFSGKITLLGVTMRESADGVAVTLNWAPQSTLITDYTAFVHLLDKEGELVAQTDRQPAGYPTGDWRAEEWIQDTFFVPWPMDRPAVWTVRTGFYDGQTLDPLGEPVTIDE